MKISVSVIIPVYNVEKHLRKSLDSIINQTLKEIEIICVDDGSTDSSAEILKEYAEKDSRIKIITQVNSGAAVARNRGLSAAIGEYVYFCDPDDWAKPKMLENMSRIADNGKCDVVVASVYFHSEELGKVFKVWKGPKDLLTKTEPFAARDIADRVFRSFLWSAWNKLFRKSFIESQKLVYQNLPRCNDIAFNATAMALATRILFDKNAYYYYRQGTEGAATSKRDSHPETHCKAWDEVERRLEERGVLPLFAEDLRRVRAIGELNTLKLMLNAESLANYYREVREKILPRYKLSAKDFVGLEGCEAQQELLQMLENNPSPLPLIGLQMSRYRLRMNAMEANRISKEAKLKKITKKLKNCEDELTQRDKRIEQLKSTIANLKAEIESNPQVRLIRWFKKRKNAMKKWLLTFIGLVVPCIAFCTAINVADYEWCNYEENDKFPSIQRAFKEAGERYASTGQVTEVIIPPGIYCVSSTLHVYSGTTIKADPKALIISTMNVDGGLLRGAHLDENGEKCEGLANCKHGGYSQIHDITIIGGSWDRDSRSDLNTYVMQLRHGENIKLENMIIRGSTNHLLNLSGTKNVTVSGVIFQEAVKYTGSDKDFWGTFKKGDISRFKTLEALHLDMIDRAGLGEKNGYPLDNTFCDNVKVSNCEFDGVFSGVGTHHVNAITGGNIEIVGCEFKNLLGFACYIYGYKTATIIDCEMEGGYGAARIEGSKTTCLIGKLVCKKSSDNAIHVDGGSTLVMTESEISDTHKDMAAVRVLGGASASVSDSKFVNPGMKALSVDEASFLIARGNVISSPRQHAIYCLGKSSLTASGNTITNPGECGLMIKGGSQATISSNKISDAKTFAVRVSEKSTATISGNKITKPKADGVFVDGESKVSVASNTITGAGERAIRLQKCSTKSTVSKNKIDTTGSEGIFFDQCQNGTITNNTIRKAARHAIRVQGAKGKAATITISNNDVGTSDPALYADIRLGDYSAKCNVSDNKLVNRLFTISKVGCSENVYKPVATTIKTVVLDKTLKTAKVSWTAQKMADGYEIQYATDSSFKSAKKLCVDGMKSSSAKLTKLDPKKTYYVRIRTYATMQKVKYYSAWSKARVLVPDYFKGTYSGYCVVKGFPALATICVNSAESVTGEIVFKGKAYPITEAQITSYSATKATAAFRTNIVIGKSSWTPTVSLKQTDAAIGAVKASISLSNLVMVANRDTELTSKKGALKALSGTKIDVTAAKFKDAGLSKSDKITISFTASAVKVTSVVKGKKNTYLLPIMVDKVSVSTKKVACTAMIPLVNYSAGYGKLLKASYSVDLKGKVSAKYSFSNLIK